MLDFTFDQPEPPPAATVPEAIDNLDRESLQKRVRDYAAANASSFKAIGLVAGIAESTFTAWLNNKYKGDNEKIDAQVRVWLKSEAQLTRRRIMLPAEQKFVQTRSAMKFISAMEFAQAMPDIAVIAAGAGVGKTSTVQHYAQTRPNVWVLTAEPSLSSHSKMMEYMRDELGIPETSRHQVSRAVAAKLANTQGLIIIDEAQHLTPKCIDQLRSVFDRSGVGLVLVGNQEVWARIDGGGRKDTLAQLFSRVGMRVTVARPSQKDIEMMLDAREVTEAKQRQILRMVANRPGALRGMEKTLRAARMIAIGAGEALDVSHLEAAWNRLSGGEGTVG